MKRFVCMALALLLCCGLVFQTNAAETEKGSIEIKVEYKDTKITGGDLIAVRVGYVDSESSLFRRVTNHAEIKNIGESTAVTQMQNFYSANKGAHTFDVYKAEVKSGVVKFTDIPLGLYLIYQETAASGYGKLSPFLVTVPYDGKTDVSAAAKTVLEKKPEPTVPGSGGGGGSGKLPQTGQLTWPVPWMALAGMVLFVFGWWLCFGKRKESL